MAKIKLTLPGLEIPVDGKQVSFTAPCDCSVVDGIQIDGVDYDVVDSAGNVVPFGRGVWCEGAVLSVILDVTNRRAYLQNQNSYTRDETLTLASAEMFGLGYGAVPNNVFSYLGQFAKHWWKSRGVNSYYKAGLTALSDKATINYGPGSSTYTLRYSNSISINQQTGEIALENPISASFSYNTDVSGTVAGKYIVSANNGTLYYVASNATFESFYNRSDGVSIYGSYLTGCSSVSSVFVEDIGDYFYLQSTDRNAHPDSGVTDGYEYEYLGIPFQNAVTASKIEIGSYTGTGEYGSSNRTILTFSAPPKVVFLSLESGNSASSPAPLVLIRGHKQGYTPTSGSSYGGYVYVTWSGNTVSLYDKNGAAGQFNSGNVVYAAIL